MEQNQSEWPPGCDRAIFDENLRALVETQPALAERICWPVIGASLREAEDGQIEFVYHNLATALELKPEAYEVMVQRALVQASQTARILVFGVGLGEIVERLQREPDLHIVAWDRDPWMMRLFLGRVDVSDALRTGRLRMAMAADLLTLLSDPTIEARVEHPFLAQLYARELSWLGGVNQQRILLCAGKLYVDSFGRCLEREGYSVWTFEVERLSREELDYTVGVIGPRAVAAINYCEGLAEFTHAHGIELIVWEIDPFVHSPSKPKTPTRQVHFFSYRDQNAMTMRALGFDHVEYLPLAADTRLRQPLVLSDAEHEHYHRSLSFAGSSMHANACKLSELFKAKLTEWARATGHLLDPTEVLNQVLEVQKRSFSRFVVPQELEAQVPGFRGWCLLEAHKSDPVILLGELAASLKRFEYLSRLAEFDLDIWGDAGWKTNARTAKNYRGLASHAHDLSRIYCASSINLDIGRIYQDDFVTMRVFDILACGGFALVEHSPALEELFEVGVELESYSSLDECCQKVQYYLAQPERAKAIAARGLEAVVSRHSFDARVRHMLTHLEADRAEGQLGLAI